MSAHATGEGRSRRGPSTLKRVGVVVYNLVAVIVIIEVVLVTMLHVPRRHRLDAASVSPARPAGLPAFQPIAHPVRPAMRAVRPRADLHAEARHVHVREHRVQRTCSGSTSAGTRDEEATLEAPDVIVLGDSHAMGWGVEQDETLPQVLARMTGLKVLERGGLVVRHRRAR